MQAENPREAVMRELWEETGVKSADYLGETDWLTYEFPPYSDRHRTGWRNFAASGKNGSRCVSPAATRNRSADTRATASRRNSTNGAGSGSTASPTSWCRSAATCTARWRGNLQNSPDRLLQSRPVNRRDGTDS